MDKIQIIALVIFAATYILMLTFQKIRPFVALGSAAVFIVLGVIPSLGLDYSIKEAVGQIDWNVLMMIFGTMGTVYLFIESKMPQRMSDILISKMPNVKWMVVCLSLFAGIVSAFVDNVATVLMIAPVAMAICKRLNISPVAPIVCIAVSSNLQGAATLVGDTTSILLAKAAQLDFFDFFIDSGKPGMFWIVQCGAIISTIIIAFMFRKHTQKISAGEKTKVEDKVPTVLLVGTVVTLILASFIPYKDVAAPGQFYKPDITNGLICMVFFLVGLVREVIKTGKTDVVKAALNEIDYSTIALLAGLFIVIGAITEAGIIDTIADLISGLGGDGNVFLVYTIIVWMSVFFSAFIDNIPYTATMLPVVAAVAADFTAGGIVVDPKLFYYGLLCGATLGGNLTPIGASANIAGIGILQKSGYEVKTSEFMKFGVPFTLSAVITGYVLIWVLWHP